MDGQQHPGGLKGIAKETVDAAIFEDHYGYFVAPNETLFDTRQHKAWVWFNHTDAEHIVEFPGDMFSDNNPRTAKIPAQSKPGCCGCGEMSPGVSQPPFRFENLVSGSYCYRITSRAKDRSRDGETRHATFARGHSNPRTGVTP
jgi:hypothetical protein